MSATSVHAVNEQDIRELLDAARNVVREAARLAEESPGTRYADPQSVADDAAGTWSRLIVRLRAGEADYLMPAVSSLSGGIRRHVDEKIGVRERKVQRLLELAGHLAHLKLTTLSPLINWNGNRELWPDAKEQLSQIMRALAPQFTS
jgi:hypothetical protein